MVTVELAVGKHLHSMSSLLALASSGPQYTHSAQDTEA